MRDVRAMRLVYYIFKKNKKIINNNNNLRSLFSIHSNLRFKHLFKKKKKIVDLRVKICELVYKDRIIQRKNNQYNIET